MNELLQRENRVLHFWTMRKRRLDQCQQYVVFERSAKQVYIYESERSMNIQILILYLIGLAPSCGGTVEQLEIPWPKCFLGLIV